MDTFTVHGVGAQVQDFGSATSITDSPVVGKEPNMPPKKDRCKAPSEAQRASAEEMAESIYLPSYEMDNYDKADVRLDIVAALRRAHAAGRDEGLEKAIAAVNSHRWDRTMVSTVSVIDLIVAALEALKTKREGGK